MKDTYYVIKSKVKKRNKREESMEFCTRDSNTSNVIRRDILAHVKQWFILLLVHSTTPFTRYISQLL